MRNASRITPQGHPPQTARWRSDKLWVGLLCAALCLAGFPALANPQGGKVSQGTASITSQGPQLTIRASDRTFINWSSFNIGLGETTSFIQPSASSVIWNQIHDVNPSQILGHLNANGYVVLQNPSGFYIGGQASITAHGLLLTTAPIPTPDLASGGAWQFSAPPPTASIINYGQISTDQGGSVFLLAHDIENHGTIAANQGTVGLYAGKDVLISERPDGRGLSARVTLPEGSVDNTGKLIADAGTIALHAQVVNQGGLVQANSVREVNGAIELVASDAINLRPGSLLSARGDTEGTSPGGSVLIKSAGSFSDQPDSAINIAGGAQAGNGGQVEISAPQMSAIQSRIDGQAAAGFLGGKFFLDPLNIVLAGSGSPAPAPGTVGAADPPANGTLTLDVTSFSSSLSQISLQAVNNIEMSTIWTLTDPGSAATLSLSAGNNILFDNGSGIRAGNNWSVNLVAGTQLTSAAARQAGSDGIYLKGNSFLQAANGNISLWAANEVIINPGPPYALSTGPVGNNGIRTVAGGSINVVAEFGDVNTGGNYQGFLFDQRNAPYYRVSPNLGGISTAAGGDVTITAAGNVASYLPVQNDYNHAQYDGGTGAFGPQPGNVTLVAGGNVSGHYVVANGVGAITAGGNIGAPTTSGGFALSLIKGSWSVSAPNGSIYLQDVRNPNGILDDRSSSAGYHYFDYDPQASLVLNAGNSVEITGAGAPHAAPSAAQTPLPFLFPPSFQVTAGPGGFVLDNDVLLLGSPFNDLQITTHGGGNFQSYQDPTDPQNVTVRQLATADTAARKWDPSLASTSDGGFLDSSVAAPLSGPNNPNPVQISIDGSMNNVILRTTKATHITVGGDLYNSGLLGENLQAGDETSVTVAGKISYPSLYTFAPLARPILGADPLNPGLWDSIFYLLVDPLQVAAAQVLPNASPQSLLQEAIALRMFRNAGTFLYDPTANPGFVYDPATGQLGFRYQMSQAVRSALEGSLQIIKLDPFGNPVIQPGQAGLGQDPAKYYFATTPVTFAPSSAIEALYQQSQTSAKEGLVSPGLQIGGPGKLTVKAASLDLGSSGGIFSWGIGNGSYEGGLNYAALAGATPAGAAVSVEAEGDITMFSSTIASIFGGDVNVKSDSGAVTLSLGNFNLVPPAAGVVCYGIFTSGDSDVTVTADKDINVGGARIATFNGGNVHVKSEEGNVNAGNGANSTLVVPVVYPDPASGRLTFGTIGNPPLAPRPYGSGILALSPTSEWQVPGSSGLPGNITVETPRGNIVSTLGGIAQFALNGNISGGPTVTLTAGTPGPGGYSGNVDLGQGGVIGGTINITAQGNIRGLIVSRQNANINAAQSFSGTLLAGGVANVTASAGGVSGTVIGIGGVTASGGAGVSASLLSQNVSIGGTAAQSTLGATAAATSTSQAAAQQSTTESQQQITAKSTLPDDDDKNKRLQRPLLRRVGRVTVILPPSS